MKITTLRYIGPYVMMVVIYCYLERENDKDLKLWVYIFLLWNERLSLLSAALQQVLKPQS